MFRQNVIKKFLINIFTMPKFFYTYKSMEFYFLEEGRSVDTFKLSSGMSSQKFFVKGELVFRATKPDIFFSGKWIKMFSVSRSGF